MVRPFAGTSLVEIAVKRLASLAGFDGIYFAAYEDVLLNVARKHLPANSIVTRSEQSALASSPITLVMEFLGDIDFDYCMWINSCHAFLRPSTIEKAANEFREKQASSMTAVRKRYSWFYSQEGESINNDPRIVSTEKSSPIFEVAHGFHIYQKDHFFRTGTYWNNQLNDPLLFVIDDLEALDVDTETDFLVAEAAYRVHKASS